MNNCKAQQICMGNICSEHVMFIVINLNADAQASTCIIYQTCLGVSKYTGKKKVTVMNYFFYKCTDDEINLLYVGIKSYTAISVCIYLGCSFSTKIFIHSCAFKLCNVMCFGACSSCHQVNMCRHQIHIIIYLYGLPIKFQCMIHFFIT